MNTLDRETIADHFKSFQAQIYERIEGFEDKKSLVFKNCTLEPEKHIILS